MRAGTACGYLLQFGVIRRGVGGCRVSGAAVCELHDFGYPVKLFVGEDNLFGCRLLELFLQLRHTAYGYALILRRRRQSVCYGPVAEYDVGFQRAGVFAEPFFNQRVCPPHVAACLGERVPVNGAARYNFAVGRPAAAFRGGDNPSVGVQPYCGHAAAGYQQRVGLNAAGGMIGYEHGAAVTGERGHGLGRFVEEPGLGLAGVFACLVNAEFHSFMRMNQEAG